MTSLRCVVSVILVVLTFTNGIVTCKGFKGLKHQRNFAHVYGKRTSNDVYSQQQTINKNHNYPRYQYQNGLPVEYDLADLIFPMLRKEPEVTTQATVASVIGRELYYNGYPKWINLLIYGVPEVEQDKLVHVPEVDDHEMVDIPQRQKQKHIGDIEQDRLTARQR